MVSKTTVAIGAIVVLAGGYFLGKSGRQEPTIIKVPEAPKEAFTSSGAEEVAAAPMAPVRSLATPTSGELIVVKDGESIQEAVKAASGSDQGDAWHLQGNCLHRQGQYHPVGGYRTGQVPGPGRRGKTQ